MLSKGGLVDVNVTAVPGWHTVFMSVSEPSHQLREWFVAAAIIESGPKVLLVQNRRRNGSLDWSTPGGVVEPGEETIDGLVREVIEETGITVTEWRGPVYSVETIAPGMGWHLRVAVYEALAWEGDIVIEDPDGIVIDARFVPAHHAAVHLAANARWVSEPITEWLEQRWDGHRTYTYDLDGADRSSIVVTRR